MRVILGRINGFYGVRGWVKVFSYTAPIANILDYSSWQLYQQGQWRNVSVSEGKIHGKGIIARLEEIHDRDAAASLLGADIAIERAQLPPTSKDEYYWTDLVGLTVLNHEGVNFGQVDHLLETGANDVLVVKGKRERLIPFLPDQVILDIDLAQHIVHVDWDEDF
ncbi:MAG: ribosome maturation factor RimM [Thiomargarita sp.]|nr:ribosome maturation factor RimM [Thiomargarita sp.]